jgi:hypothetical protein
MISTTAFLPIAFEMLLALVLNVPHCLQASIKTCQQGLPYMAPEKTAFTWQLAFSL